MALLVVGFALPVGAAPLLRPGEYDSTLIPKYEEPLLIPPVMEPVGEHHGVDYYEISLRQFQQQVLPPVPPLNGSDPLPDTTVWGYGSPAAGNHNSPAFTIETRTNERIRVKWINELVNDPTLPPEQRVSLPHLFAVDPTLHWANPPGPPDTRPMFDMTPGPYTGPVPIVTHVHGAHVPAISDGYPEAWFLPAASDVSTYVPRGTHYGSVRPVEDGAALFEYTNDQLPATLWYHDHALGITRLNVYAGTAGFYLLRDHFERSLNLPGPAPRRGDPLFTDRDNPSPYFEIPIAIQDRSFVDTSSSEDGSETNGSLFYPDSRAFFGDIDPSGPFIPDSNVSPIWNPEFFGNAVVVNGRTWPYLNVQPRKYRLRFLNGCNSRFVILEFRVGGTDGPARTFHQIGTDGGFLSRPVELTQVILGPAERADVIIDFAGLPQGTEVFLRNLGPDEPFKGPNVVLDPADEGTTGQVMKIIVATDPVSDHSTLPRRLRKVKPFAMHKVDKVRDLTLNEIVNQTLDIPIAALLGTAEYGPIDWAGITQLAHRAVKITEKPKLDAIEVWRLINLTEDAHPIHLHLVQFQVIKRQAFDAAAYTAAQEAYIMNPVLFPKPDIESFLIGMPIEPDLNEQGWKDTVRANPGEVTYIIQRFTKPGLYVWHCHILEHEDNEMMRPYKVIDGRHHRDDDHHEPYLARDCREEDNDHDH